MNDALVNCYSDGYFVFDKLLLLAFIRHIQKSMCVSSKLETTHLLTRIDETLMGYPNLIECVFACASFVTTNKCARVIEAANCGAAWCRTGPGIKSDRCHSALNAWEPRGGGPTRRTLHRCRTRVNVSATAHRWPLLRVLLLLLAGQWHNQYCPQKERAAEFLV